MKEFGLLLWHAHDILLFSIVEVADACVDEFLDVGGQLGLAHAVISGLPLLVHLISCHRGVVFRLEHLIRYQVVTFLLLGELGVAHNVLKRRS